MWIILSVYLRLCTAWVESLISLFSGHQQHVYARWCCGMKPRSESGHRCALLQIIIRPTVAPCWKQLDSNLELSSNLRHFYLVQVLTQWASLTASLWSVNISSSSIVSRSTVLLTFQPPIRISRVPAHTLCYLDFLFLFFSFFKCRKSCSEK